MKTTITRKWNIVLTPDQLWFNALLGDLHATGLLAVTGSYADGTATNDSDLDFYVHGDSLTKIIAILQAYELPMGSSVVGHISVGYPPHMGVCPIQLEFSYLFNHRPHRDKNVVINGFNFRTW